jgi:uncharacterized protein (DUF433 family)
MTSLAPAWGTSPEVASWAPRPACRGGSPGGFMRDDAYNITRDKSIWSGMAVVIGTRIPVFLIDDLYNETGNIAEVLAAYPRLSEGDIFYALAYARDYAGLVSADRNKHYLAIAEAIG